MNIVRITRHFNIAFKKATITVNPKLFKKNGEIRKNSVKKLVWTKEMHQAHAAYARAFNLSLRKGINLERDIVCGNSSYNV